MDQATMNKIIAASYVTLIGVAVTFVTAYGIEEVRNARLRRKTTQLWNENAKLAEKMMNNIQFQQIIEENNL